MPSKSLLDVMKKLNIAADDILTVTCTDLSVDCDFIFTWLVLTKERVYILFSDKVNDAIDHSSRTDGRNNVPADVKIEQMDLSKIDRFETVSLAAGCVISAVSEGKPRKICAASATCAPGANHFAKCVMLAKEKNYARIAEMNEKRRHTNGVCKKCGTPYKEYGNRICPKCNSRRSSMLRLLKLFLPYKK